MPIHALWPRSRRERTLAARCLRLADTLRTQTADRERLARERDTALWLLAEERHRLGTWAMDAARFLCPDCDPLRRELAAATRLLHAHSRRAEAVRLYQAGVLVQDIADTLGCDRKTVHVWVRAAGIPLRGKGTGGRAIAEGDL